MKTALVTGYTGQDGTFLTRLLLDKGYKVVGLCRRVSTEPPRRVRGKFDFSAQLASGRLVLEQGDLLSVSSLLQITTKHRPDEIYNLAAQSHVGASFGQPEFTTEADYLGVINLITALEVVEALGDYKWKLYQASTSEMFGNLPQSENMLTEATQLRPISPYAIAKTAAHHFCGMKRAQGKFIACGILFNHESEIRGGDFVTQKIARAVAALDAYTRGGLGSGVEELPILRLGNLSAGRDWGYAGDYVRAMHAMFQAEKPGDYVIATGQTHTVREFVQAAVMRIGKEITWSGEDLGEIGMIDGKVFVVVDPEFFRPNDVTHLNGSAAKAQKELGWKPEVEFDELVGRMVDAQLEVKL